MYGQENRMRKQQGRWDGGTGKSLSEALILASTNPQYEKDCLLIYQVST